MENSIYVDTNIFLDLLDNTRPFFKGSLELIKNYISEGIDIYINSDTVTTAFYILNRQKIYSNSKLIEILKKYISLFSIVSIEKEDIFLALELCEKSNKFRDYEDALQYICAKKIKAVAIVTNDKNFISKDIKIVRSKEAGLNR